MGEFFLGGAPVDVEGGGMGGTGSDLEDIPPPAVVVVGDAHVIGDDIGDEAEVRGVGGGGECGKSRFTAGFGIQFIMGGDVVAVLAAGGGAEDGREVEVADAEGREVVRESGGGGKGEL